MKESITITVPESLDDITIRQLAQYMAGDLESEDKALESALAIFCGIDIPTQKKVVKSQLDALRTGIINVLNEKPSIKIKFKHKGIEYGFVPNIEEITAGEFIDAETYMGDYANMHKAVAVLYRPIVDSGKGWYEIEPYEGSDKYAGVLQDAPASVAVGMLLFFWTIANDLLSATIKRSVQVQMDAGLMPEVNSLIDGVGTLPYSTLRGEMLWYLTKLLGYRFTNS